jgi:hypothetical protein
MRRRKAFRDIQARMILSLLGVDGEVLRLAFDPDVSAHEVERHDVAGPRDADAVERDQPNGCDKIGEPEELKD